MFSRVIHESEAAGAKKLTLVCPAPGGKWEKLLLQGVGLTAVEAQIKKLKAAFPKYQLFISDAKPAFMTNEDLPVYTIPFCGTPFYLSHASSYGLNKRGLGYVATIGGFLCDNDEQRSFAFTAAHALVSEEDQTELSQLFGEREQLKDYTKQICVRLSTDVLERNLKIHSHNNGSQMDVFSIPLFATQLYIKMSDMLMPYQKFTMDFMLLPVSPMSVYRDAMQKIPFSEINKFKGRKSLGMSLEDEPKEYQITHYLNIESEQDIENLRNNRVVVFVAGQSGTIEIAPSSLQGSEYIHGWHIAFKTENA